MLADTYIGFLKIYHGLRRGRLPRGLTAKDALNLDLQLKYGWRPLASDLFEMYRLAKEGLTTRPLIFHASREIKTQRTIPWNAVYGRVGNASVNSSVKTKLYAMVSGSLTDALNQIGLTNPAQIAWELVPYSFVWDWAMPIGSFLQNSDRFGGPRLPWGLHNYLS
nr:MAG: maturation protein [Sanya fiers-like virus 27]